MNKVVKGLLSGLFLFFAACSNVLLGLMLINLGYDAYGALFMAGLIVGGGGLALGTIMK